MNTDAIGSMVRDVLNRMNSLQDAAPVSAVPNASILSAKVTDYPLANKHPEWVKTATNKTLDDFTLENVLSDNVTALDMRITPETLRIQAAIARDAGRDRLAMNFERAAELTSQYQMIASSKSTMRYALIVQLSKNLLPLLTILNSVIRPKFVLHLSVKLRNFMSSAKTEKDD